MAEPIRSDSDSAELISDEEKLHARVQSRIAVGPKDVGDRVGAQDIDRDLIELRDAISEARPEDLPPLVEQMTRLAAIRGRLGGSLQLPVDPTSPYFAHMVLHEDGKSREVLIGKRGFIDRKSNVQIVDWRNAPISQIYYRYDEGDDYDEEVAGRELSGLVEIRRNVSIRNSMLRRIGTPQGTFLRDEQGQWHQAFGSEAPVLQGGSGKAVRAPKAPTMTHHKRGAKGQKLPNQSKLGQSQLGVHGRDQHRADKHLPEIAALIDKEQFRLITQPQSGLVVIQGGAGSGKTTIALHRIAFLCFSDRKRFRPNRMLFVVPSSALARYVAAVLPSLGVSGVPVVTYDHWARSLRKKLLRGTSGKSNEDTPDSVSRLKKHPGLLGLLDEYVLEQTVQITQQLEDALASVDSSGETMRKWTELAGRAPVPRLRQLRKWTATRPNTDLRVAAQSAIAAALERANDVVEDWADALTDRPRMARWLGKETSAGEIDALVRWVGNQDVDMDELADAADAGIEGIDGRSPNQEQPTGLFDAEDDPLLLRLIQLKRGALVSNDVNAIAYSHVAIDEAQDRSAMEVKVLLDATESSQKQGASVTIAGDTAQRLVFDNNFSGWASLLKYTGQDHVAVQPLKLSYRSTAEVMELARAILGPDLAPDEDLFARSGAPVELHRFGDVGEAVAFLGEALRNLMTHEASASVVVIARYDEQATAYFHGLQKSEVPSLRRVRQQNFTFAPGVDVTDVAQVKGLEFDYVIMVDVNANTYPDTVESRHLLHIAATRAAHQLWLIATDTPSPLLPEHMRRF